MKQPEKRKEKPKKQEKQKKPNPIESVTIDILQSKKSDQKLWLSFQDIVDGFQNKALLIDYWNKPDEFKEDLLQTFSTLEAKEKIKKKIYEQASYITSHS